MRSGNRARRTMIRVGIGICGLIFGARDGATQPRLFLDAQYDTSVSTFEYGLGDVQIGGEVIPGFTYPQRRLLLDLYKPLVMGGGPALPAASPAIILIHGGGFTTGERDNPGWIRPAEYFASRGFVVASIDYRLQGDDPPVAESTPLGRAIRAGAEDSFKALGWMQDNALLHGFQADRIGVGGHSAGSILAQFLGYTEVPTVIKPRAVLALGGASDILFDRLDSTDPHTLIVHGQYDVASPLENAIALNRLLIKEGVPTEFRIMPGGAHRAPVQWDDNGFRPAPLLGPTLLLQKYVNFFYEELNAEELVIPAACYAGGFYVVECAGASAAVQLDGSLSTGFPEPWSIVWTTTHAGAVFDDPTRIDPVLTVDTSAVGCGVEFDVVLTITNDVFGTIESCSAKVIVDDSLAPALEFTGFTPSPGSLPAAGATDACDPAPAVESDTIFRFEGLADGLVVTNEIDGLTIVGATISTDSSLPGGGPETDIAPFTKNVLRPTAAGLIDITFDANVSDISYLGWSSPSQSVEVRTFDEFGALIALRDVSTFDEMMRVDVADVGVRRMTLTISRPEFITFDDLAVTYSALPVGQSARRYSATDHCDYPSEPRDLSVFVDRFEDTVFTDSNWTPRDPPEWSAGSGLLTGNAAASMDQTFIAANSMGCASRSGFNIYRNTVMTMNFDMTYLTNVTGTGAGGVLLVDVTHPEVLPVVFFDLIVLSVVQPGGAVLDIPHFLLGQFNNFDGPVPPGTTEPIIMDGFGLPATFDIFAPHHYEAQLLGDEIRVTMDGVHSLTGTVQPLSVPGAERLFQGAAGLFVGAGNIATFDNFELAGEELCVENTPAGFEVQADLTSGATATFEHVTSEGSTTITRSVAPPPGMPLPSTFTLLGEVIDVSTTAAFDGLIEICIPYDETAAPADETMVRLLHYETSLGAWVDVTSRVDIVANFVCALVDNLSPFAPALRSLDVGFLNPIGDATTEENPAGPFKARRTIPIKIELRNPEGDLLPDTEALALDVKLETEVVSAAAGDGDPIETGDNPGTEGDRFRYDEDSDLFIFNLSTKGPQWVGGFTYRAAVVIDGLEAAEVFFSLR